MTRAELIARLSKSHPQFRAEEIDAAVRALLAAIADALARGGRVEIRGFGSFTLHYRAARLARNPRNGELVSVPAKYVPYFRAGKALRERVNGLGVRGDDASSR